MSCRAAFTGDVLTREAGPEAGFVRDDRGVIMIVGVMFTFLWIGLAWAIFGIGNAITYRENLQNASDASAFAAAVYDARGMNMLASINILMGVVLAVLLAAHVIQLGVFLVEAASCAICCTELSCLYGWAECPDDCSTVNDINQDLVANVDSIVHDILPVLHDLEVGVAAGWPWVASGKSTTLVTQYYPHGIANHGVALASTFSWSQIAYGMGALGSAIDNFGGFAGVQGDSGSGDSPYGLPVVSDKYSNLCNVAFIDMDNLGGLINMPSFITGFLQSWGYWFCDAGSEGSWSKWAVEIGSSLMLDCWLWDGFYPTIPMGDGSMDGTVVKDDDHSQSPMKIYPDAKMGFDYYGVWSTAIGIFSSDLVTNKVQIAGQQAKSGNKVVAGLPDDALLGIAKSEFYYDPMPGDSKDDETHIGDSWPIHDVMWNLRWRARLRRYHYMPGLAGDLDAMMNMNWTKAAEAAGKGLIDGDTISQIVNNVMKTAGGGVEVNTYHNKPLAGVYH